MEQAESPHVVIVAVPNGAGKSTAAPELLRDYLGLTEFVNADVIAQGLSGFHPDGVAIQAGQLMLERLHELAQQRVSFSLETTLAAKSCANCERRATNLIFFSFGFRLQKQQLLALQSESRVEATMYQERPSDEGICLAYAICLTFICHWSIRGHYLTTPNRKATR